MTLDADLRFLCDDFGLRVVHEEAPRPGERMTLVLQAGDLRTDIELELGVRVIYFSSVGSPAERHVDNALLNFIEHRHGLPREDDPISRLRSHMREIVAAFASPPPVEWWKAYAAFREERLRAMRKK